MVAAKRKTDRYQLRRSSWDGICVLCQRKYQIGQMIAGQQGYWFHERHLSPERSAMLWTKRTANQTNPSKPVLAGGWETKRRKH
jgi:hypothetical protein